jgi:Tol biopolymer transport system component
MRVAAALLAVLGATLVVATPAPGSQLVFACGPAFEDLCRARPDGAVVQPLTTDGDASLASDHVYRGAALSRDGRRLAYVVDSDVFLRDMVTGAVAHARQQNSPALVRFRADGVRFAVAEAGTFGGTQLCAYNTALDGVNEGRYCLATGVSSGLDYLPDGRLIMATSGGTATGGRTIVVLLRPEDGGPTGRDRILVDDPSAYLASPSASPDGRFVAVVAAASDDVRGDIAVYDLATGALVRRLTTGGGAGAPAFSPDGRQVAFDRNGAIWVTAVDGAPGSERRIAAGRSVAWGGGDLTAFSALRVAARQRGAALRGSVRVGIAGSRVTVEVRARGRRAGRIVRRSVAAGRLRFTVRLDRRGRRSLARARALRVTLRIAVTPPGSRSQTATRRVTLTARP